MGAIQLIVRELLRHLLTRTVGPAKVQDQGRSPCRLLRVHRRIIQPVSKLGGKASTNLGAPQGKLGSCYRKARFADEFT